MQLRGVLVLSLSLLAGSRAYAQVDAFLATAWEGFARPLAQTTAASASQSEVLPTKLVPPTYPPIAVSARVAGDVEVNVAVRPDGHVESATVVRGTPLLQAAALDAARKSEFECRGCSAVTRYSLVFAFRLEDAGEVGGTSTPVDHPSRGQSRVTVVAPPQRLYVIFSFYPVRSAKCAYLWECGRRWAGYDFYCVRVRSPRCLWLWRCADRCPRSGSSDRQFDRGSMRDERQYSAER